MNNEAGGVAACEVGLGNLDELMAGRYIIHCQKLADEAG